MPVRAPGTCHVTHAVCAATQHPASCAAGMTGHHAPRHTPCRRRRPTCASITRAASAVALHAPYQTPFLCDDQIRALPHALPARPFNMRPATCAARRLSRALPHALPMQPSNTHPAATRFRVVALHAPCHTRCRHCRLTCFLPRALPAAYHAPCRCERPSHVLSHTLPARLPIMRHVINHADATFQTHEPPRSLPVQPSNTYPAMHPASADVQYVPCRTAVQRASRRKRCRYDHLTRTLSRAPQAQPPNTLLPQALPARPPNTRSQHTLQACPPARADNKKAPGGTASTRQSTMP